MIHSISLSTKEQAEQRCYDLIHRYKSTSQSKYSVVDVGGSHCPWSKDIVDCVVDLNTPNFPVTYYSGDINDNKVWDKLESDGKIFDFCICSHTLEDISNPKFVCERISRIAKSGFISVPSKYQELCPGESGSSVRGWFHHKWIFTIHNGLFTGLPKLNLIEELSERDYFNLFAAAGLTYPNLSFYWCDDISLKIVKDGFLAPNRFEVMNAYKDILSNDIFEQNRDQWFK